MGLISQVCILKFGMPDVEFEPYIPQGEALVLSSIQVVVHCSVDWFYLVPHLMIFCASLSCWFDVIFLLFAGYIIIILPTFRFFFLRGSLCICNCLLFPWEKVSLGSSYGATLN